MGNGKSKTCLSNLLEKWEESDPYGKAYKYYGDKSNNLTIHRFDGEYFVKNNVATIGPMTKEQVLMFLNKNSTFRMKNYTCESSIPEIHSKSKQAHSLVSSLNNVAGNALKIKDFRETDDDQTNYIPKFSSQNISGKKLNKFIKFIEIKKKYEFGKNGESDDCISNLIDSIYEDSPRKYDKKIFAHTTCQTEDTNLATEKEDSQLKNKNERSRISIFKLNENKFFKSNNKSGRKAGISNLKYLMNVPNRKSIVTRATEMNLGLARKRKAKIQLHEELIAKYKDSLKNLENNNETNVLPNGDSGAIYKSSAKGIGFSEPLSNEKFRYTAYVNADYIDLSKQKSIVKRLQLSFQTRYGCSVHLGDQGIYYRGNIVYTINVDGKTKIGILKCRNNLPGELRSNLILPQENSEETDMILREKFNPGPYCSQTKNKYISRALLRSY